jgi:hypothetical protein
VRAHRIVIFHVALEDVAKVLLACHYDVVQAFPAYRADQALRIRCHLKRRAAKFNLFRDQARESSERPILSAFCRIAPSDLFKRRAIVAAGTFFRANDLSSRTCTDVQKRIFDPFFMSISMYER